MYFAKLLRTPFLQNTSRRLLLSLETSQNMLEKNGRRNNIEISGNPDSVEQTSVEEKVASVVSNIGVDVISNDIEACHRIGKSQNN